MEQLEAAAAEGAVLRLDDEGLLRGLADLRWHLDDLLVEGSRELVVDITGLARLSSATLAALLWAQRACRSRGGRVVLLGPNRRCREVLARTGLLDLFAVVPAAPGGAPPRLAASSGGLS